MLYEAYNAFRERNYPNVSKSGTVYKMMVVCDFLLDFTTVSA